MRRPHPRRSIFIEGRGIMARRPGLGFAAVLALVATACSEALGPRCRLVPRLATTATRFYVSHTHARVLDTLSGAVVETLGQGSRPLAGVSVNAWVQESSFGYSYMWAHGPTTTDHSEAFRLPGLPAGVTVQPQLWKDGVLATCAAPVVTVKSDLHQDAQLVSRASVPVSPDALAPPAPGSRSVTGTIVENTADGPRPLAGVFVDFEPIMDFPAAVTSNSDAAGRYMLFGLPDGQTVSIGAGLGNRVTYVNVAPGRTTGVDIVLP